MLRIPPARAAQRGTQAVPFRGVLSAGAARVLDGDARLLGEDLERAFEIEPFDRFEMLERDKDASLDELLGRFAELRARSIAEFEAMVGEDDLPKSGLHPAMGEVTLEQLLNTWAVHDLDHTAQVFAGMAGSHDAAVGPWKQYLGILLRRTDPAATPG